MTRYGSFPNEYSGKVSDLCVSPRMTVFDVTSTYLMASTLWPAFPVFDVVHTAAHDYNS